jgi:MFS family permease
MIDTSMAVRSMTEIYPKKLTAYSLLAVLFLASILGTTDRSILNFLVGPIRRELKISDVQMSLLQGLSFTIVYAFSGLVLGLLADKVARTRLLAVGIAVWSAGTLMGGLAPGLSWLFASRILVGLGEAALPPCAISLLCDSFVPSWRGRAISVYLLGGAMATGLAGLLVGWILTAAPEGKFDFIPGAAGASAWRIALVGVGMAGMVIAVLLAVQAEPGRHGSAISAGTKPALRPIAGYLFANRTVFVPLYLAFTMASIATYGIVAWGAPVLTRQFGLSPGNAGHDLGLAFLIAGILGALTAGQILDNRVFLRGRLGKMTALTILPLCMLPAAATTLAPDGLAATWAEAVAILVGPMISVVMMGALSEMMPNDMRGLSVSILGFAGTMLGGTLGPLLIAECTQHVLRDGNLVGRGILMVTGPCLLLASAGFFWARQALIRSLSGQSSLCQVMAADRPEARPPARQ